MHPFSTAQPHAKTQTRNTTLRYRQLSTGTPISPPQHLTTSSRLPPPSSSYTAVVQLRVPREEVTIAFFAAKWPLASVQPADVVVPLDQGAKRRSTEAALERFHQAVFAVEVVPNVGDDWRAVLALRTEVQPVLAAKSQLRRETGLGRLRRDVENGAGRPDDSRRKPM